MFVKASDPEHAAVNAARVVCSTNRFEHYPQLSWIEPFVAWRGMATGIDIALERLGDSIPREVAALTGKEIMRGNPSVDLGYFLQGACTVEDRRAAERVLVEEYRLALDLNADELPSSEEVWLRYRASTAHGLALWLVTAASDWQRFDVSLTLSQWYAAAFVDLDGAAAIGELTDQPSPP